MQSRTLILVSKYHLYPKDSTVLGKIVDAMAWCDKWWNEPVWKILWWQKAIEFRNDSHLEDTGSEIATQKKMLRSKRLPSKKPSVLPFTQCSGSLVLTNRLAGFTSNPGATSFPCYSYLNCWPQCNLKKTADKWKLGNWWGSAHVSSPETWSAEGPPWAESGREVWQLNAVLASCDGVYP